MCGRFVNHTPMSFVAERHFNVRKPVGDRSPHYNLSPGVQVPGVHRHPETGEPIFTGYLWGYRPQGAGEGAPVPINARAESLQRSRYFQEAFSRRRCVICADGWYEWRQTAEGKQPYYITQPTLPRRDVLFFAAIFDYTGHGISTCAAIITEPAAPSIRHIHDRQPVLLDPESLTTWLDPALLDTTRLKGAIRRVDPSNLASWPVSSEVNNVKNNGPELIQDVSTR